MASCSTFSASWSSSWSSRGWARSCSAYVERPLASCDRGRHEGVMASPIKVTELDHVVLRCRDQGRMLDFYTEVLGMTEERRMVALVPGAPGSFESANVDHLCLMLAPVPLEDVARHLAERGVETIGEPMIRYGATGNGPSLYIRDPEGNVVELKVPGDAR